MEAARSKAKDDARGASTILLLPFLRGPLQRRNRGGLCLCVFGCIVSVWGHILLCALSHYLTSLGLAQQRERAAWTWNGWCRQRKTF